MPEATPFEAFEKAIRSKRYFFWLPCETWEEYTSGEVSFIRFDRHNIGRSKWPHPDVSGHWIYPQLRRIEKREEALFAPDSTSTHDDMVGFWGKVHNHRNTVPLSDGSVVELISWDVKISRTEKGTYVDDGTKSYFYGGHLYAVIMRTSHNRVAKMRRRMVDWLYKAEPEEVIWIATYLNIWRHHLKSDPKLR